MPTPFEQFSQRFGGQQLGAYNPFQLAPQYQSPYTHGAFGAPAAPGTPATQPPGGVLSGGAPAGGQAAGGAPGEGGRGNISDRPMASDPGWGPGRSDTAGVIGSLIGLGIPGAGALIGAGNAAAGLQAANQQVAATDLDLSFADKFYAATGMDLFGSANRAGVGGYGDLGVNPGGSAGALNFADPGVMGAARALAASNVNAVNPAGPIAPAPGGVLSGAPTAPSGGVLSTTPSTPGMAVPTTPAGVLAAPAPVSAADAAAARAAFAGSIPQGPERQAIMAAYDKSVAGLSAGGNMTASALSQAAQLAKSQMGLQQGKSGVSGSQIAGGRTVGNNPNDRSGRNPGAPRDAGAGGRLGGGV